MKGTCFCTYYSKKCFPINQSFFHIKGTYIYTINIFFGIKSNQYQCYIMFRTIITYIGFGFCLCDYLTQVIFYGYSFINLTFDEYNLFYGCTIQVIKFYFVSDSLVSVLEIFILLPQRPIQLTRTPSPKKKKKKYDFHMTIIYLHMKSSKFWTISFTNEKVSSCRNDAR